MYLKKLLFILTASFSFTAFAEQFQILHTSDLHSHLEHTIHRPQIGGYGRLRLELARLKGEARDRGIDTIAMDGGDFLEGNIFYMADNGRKSALAYNKIGFDVAVLGNHDYLMAAQDLENLLRDVPPSMALLAANLELDSRFPIAKKIIKPVWETTVNGIKVGVIGLTLRDMLYKWRLKGDGMIYDEVTSTRQWARYLRSRGNEIIIALTHIGLKKDKSLAANIPELDFIIGGHDHSTLKEPVYQTSSNGKKIPIFQPGEFGEWIGKLVLDYDRKSKTTKVIHYELHPVATESTDPEMMDIIADANYELDTLYGKEWLEGIVGKSFLRPIKENNDTAVWNFYVNDSMMEAVDADFAIHTNSISGGNYPLGNVTRRSLYNGNPRHFELSEKYGYRIYTAMVSGFWIKYVAKICLKLNVPLYFSGLSFKWKKKSNGKYEIWDIQHKGKKIQLFRRYKVAFSEAIVRGGFGITGLVRYIFHFPQNTATTMWAALEAKFNREGELHPDYVDTYYRQHLLKSGYPVERVMIK
ncbi:MAG TPA: metallophosphoesterase [Bacteriovoracaceae bacterium]|nr:metallophosphoesterase [Bacteriovoracaceae bacterium]